MQAQSALAKLNEVTFSFFYATFYAPFFATDISIPFSSGKDKVVHFDDPVFGFVIID